MPETDPGTLDTTAAYALGIADAAGHSHIIGGRHTAREAVDAAANWKRAQAQDEHVNYYGAAHVRSMRAFWLGVTRATRHAEGTMFWRRVR